jgi:L-serine dehydratase
MTAAPYPDFFNDVFGPVMQPGSSSHTAAPCRLGKLAADLLGEPVASARVVLDKQGSYAGTFGIMAEDRAMVAGVLGLSPDDERLFRAFELADEAGIEVSFVFNELPESEHPNAMKFVLTGAGGRAVELVGNSTGGGMVETVVVDGFPLRLIGDTFVLLLFDRREAGGASALEQVEAELPARVRQARIRVTGRGSLHAFELPVQPDVPAVRAVLDRLLPGVRMVVLEPLLPVVTQPDRKPQLFDTMTRWREIAEDRGAPLWEVAVQYEIDASGWPRVWIVERMRTLAGLMHRQTRAAFEPGAEIPTSPFKPDFASRWAAHAASRKRLTDELTARTVKWAYGAGAGIPGVQTVPGPMGSGGGYVYAAMSAVRDARGLSDDDLLRGLFVAAGVGVVAFTVTEPTGEVIGCSGEAGVCGAMAAAGIVEMVGGTPQHAEDAASLTLQAFTGMPCDPMPGGLCMPCRSRVLAATCMAHVFADMALAGHNAVLPLHEALEVADTIGRGLPPELLCTAEGGACSAPAAQRYRTEYQRWFDESRPEHRPPGNLI